MCNQALVGRVGEFNGVLNGDDSQAVLAVEVVNHGGQGGALAAAGGARDQHQPPRLFGNLLDHRWQEELLEGLDCQGNSPGDEAKLPLLVEHVDAESRHFGDAVGEIAAPFGVDALHLSLIGRLGDELTNLVGRNGGYVHRLYNAVKANHGGASYLDVQVAGAELNGCP